MRFTVIFLLCLFFGIRAFSQSKNQSDYNTLVRRFQHPPDDAKPWVFWYWMNDAVSEEGIKADLIAMKQNGIGGAYLMTILGAPDSPFVQPPAVQLSPLWWKMIRYTFHVADSLHFKLAMHDCDGFALAGGPWITPEKSMQKVVWTKTIINGGRRLDTALPQPETREHYYRDIAVYAYPAKEYDGVSADSLSPQVTSDVLKENISFITHQYNNESIKLREPGYIQYQFTKPFTCRSIKIKSKGYNYQANRLLIQTSNDGVHFTNVVRLVPPRTGWEDSSSVTHTIPATTAKYFRFVYDSEGSEPGAEDLDAAKWKQSLSIKEIQLSSEPYIYQYESKNGEVWRISKRGSGTTLPDSLCIPLDSIRNITSYLSADGNLNWDAPPGRWVILRMGHTSTGYTNATGGGGKGLECDKFDTSVAALQFRSWFGEAIKQVGKEEAKRVLSIFHIDSWECGSQNWSPVFRDEFQRRRGYDLMDYLPAMAGVPLESNEQSERFLHDIRQTIAELVVDNFYGTMAKLAHNEGCTFSGESIAPTMMSDGMMHYKQVDLPMGEFWYNSPTHDKPNDLRDAVSGAHIYNKNIVQAEAFTTLRMDWNEHPALLKTTGDRAYADGINRFVYHVYTHNPFPGRKPGMTLNGVGLLFQRDQTWWKEGKAWIEYASRCQALLQSGTPVVDIAVFAGKDEPVRSVLPERLVNALPGIFGSDRVMKEQERLANRNSPLREQPAGVFSSANTVDPANWTDALRGYKYDSFNSDAFLETKVKDGKVVFANGVAYRVLVFPGETKMNPNGTFLSLRVAKHIEKLLQQGATILLPNKKFTQTPGLRSSRTNDEALHQLMTSFYQKKKKNVSFLPWREDDFSALGVTRDIMFFDEEDFLLTDFAWAHRSGETNEMYFISNQKREKRYIKISFRVSGKIPQIWDAVTGEIQGCANTRFEKGRTVLSLTMEANQSLFVIFSKSSPVKPTKPVTDTAMYSVADLENDWQVHFDTAFGGPKQPVHFDSLLSWTKSKDSSVRFYSGTAVYTKTIPLSHIDTNNNQYFLTISDIDNLAEVIINGTSCGVIWTYPYRICITNALQQGTNKIEIKVTNTWHNRMILDHSLPEEQRVSWTNAPFRLAGEPLLPAGMLGKVCIVQRTKP